MTRGIRLTGGGVVGTDAIIMDWIFHDGTYAAALAAAGEGAAPEAVADEVWKARGAELERTYRADFPDQADDYLALARRVTVDLCRLGPEAYGADPARAGLDDRE